MVILFAISGFIIGTVLGSLTKALADRSLSRKSFWSRSICPKCKTTLCWYDLIPIVSFLLIRGKCRYCSKKISLEYLIVEIASGLLFALFFTLSFANFSPFFDAYQKFIFFQGLAFKSFIITILMVVTLTDFKKTLIPDRIILPAIYISAFYLLIITIVKVWYLYYVLSQSGIGRLLIDWKNGYFLRHALMSAEPLTNGLIMAASLGLFFYLLIVITKGRGMGGGDFKLGIFMGFTLGFPNSLVALMLSFLTGSIVGIGLIILGKKKLGQTIPFGPFLALGSLISIFWADKIINWYLSLKI